MFTCKQYEINKKIKIYCMINDIIDFHYLWEKQSTVHWGTTLCIKDDLQSQLSGIPPWTPRSPFHFPLIAPDSDFRPFVALVTNGGNNMPATARAACRTAAMAAIPWYMVLRWKYLQQFVSSRSQCFVAVVCYKLRGPAWAVGSYGIGSLAGGNFPDPHF